MGMWSTMNGLAMLGGAALTAITLADIYLTVLKGGPVSLLSGPLASAAWRGFRRAAMRLDPWRNLLLSYAGPTIVALIVVAWAALLVVGFALIYWPGLGTAIRMSEGATPERFSTALYFSAMSLSTLSTGDIAAVTAPYRLLSVAQALVGFSVLTMTITYLLSVYRALDRHNSLALALHHGTGDSDDAAGWIARLGAGGDFEGSRQELARLGDGLMKLIAAHRTHLVLRYFRPEDATYSLPRIAFLTLDTATLLCSAIDQDRYRGHCHLSGDGAGLGRGHAVA